MKVNQFFILMAASVLPFDVMAKDAADSGYPTVADEVIFQQRQKLSVNTAGKGFGPQSPRDIDSIAGKNSISFNAAPPYLEMNLCNIHFHKNAEHKGGEYTKYAGNGDGQGYQSGYQYSGQLTTTELSPPDNAVCQTEHGGIYPGDTIEVHYVYSSAQVKPGPTLGSCMNDSIKNPQLRIETQIYVLVNDKSAGDFGELTMVGKKNGLHQALNIPDNTGIPIQYAGSTTGPGYNEKGSPYQVSWSVRPKVAKAGIQIISATLMVERQEVANCRRWYASARLSQSKYHHELSAVDRGETIPDIGSPYAGIFAGSDRYCRAPRKTRLIRCRTG